MLLNPKDIRKVGEKRRQDKKIGRGKKSREEVGKVRRKGSWEGKGKGAVDAGWESWNGRREGKGEGRVEGKVGM